MIPHLVLGVLILAAFLVQPFLGLIHHQRFKKIGRRTAWSHLHLWIGRVGITLGIINGGLGLWVAAARREYAIVYGVFAGVVWLIWMGIAVLSEVRRARAKERGHKTDRSRLRRSRA